MTRGVRAIVVAAAVAAAVCVALGVWQLRRLDQRRAYNAAVLARYDEPAVPLDSLRGDPSALEFRRVIVSGRYDAPRELALANRPRMGAPGVHVLTPLLTEGDDSATIVVRGWVYAPDAARADLTRWRESSAAEDTGYVKPFASASTRQPSPESRIVRSLDRGAIARAMPYPVRPYVVVLTSGDGEGSGAPPRVGAPSLSDGPHRSYAVQWFSFAFIAVAGAVIVALRARSGSFGTDSRFRPE